MALYQGVLSSSNSRLRGYRVTNGLNFFFNFLSNVRLRGYRVTNRLNFLSLNFQNEKVTRLPGLQGLRWATRLNLIFLNLLIPGYEVTGFRRLHGYGIAKSSIYLAISINWESTISSPKFGTSIVNTAYGAYLDDAYAQNLARPPFMRICR